jgi:DNA-binding NarL/FixJ family response regulator
MKVVIVEDHLMFREVLRKVCTVDLKLEVVAEVGDGLEAVAAVERMQPDLVLLDLHLPNLDGFGVIEEIRKSSPHVKVLVLSSHCDEYTVFCSERARVQGFVDKNTNSVESLKTAITLVASGKVWFSPAFQQIKAARRRDPKSFDKLLTDRERDVLALIGTPLTDEEIAHRLEISRETAEKHRFNILKKLELKTTTELARYAKDHGFTLRSTPAGPNALLP